MRILVTGAAGFIGMHVSKMLCEKGIDVLGIDNLNDYYDVSLKEARLAQLSIYSNFLFKKLDLADRDGMRALFQEEEFDRVIHLAAQAGVRHSIEAPFSYVDSNLNGMMTILEGCRQKGVKHLIYASSSSVYGQSDKIPFSESDQVDKQVSLYAATKKCNEILAASYAHLYNIPMQGLRFFTVYGPWGRPDMAPWLFSDAILNDRPITVFNNGDMLRDFTYIDDAVEAIFNLIAKPPIVRQGSAPHEIFNIGNSSPVRLMDFIQSVENACGKSAEKLFKGMQQGDVTATYADTSKLEDYVNFKPNTQLNAGIAAFVSFLEAYQSKANAQNVEVEPAFPFGLGSQNTFCLNA